MTIPSTDYALLAQDSYKNRALKEEVILGGVSYRVMDHIDNPRTGFQATAYLRPDTGETVIAYRGTEFDREPVHDGLVDAGMALAGVNAQKRDADAFTQRVLTQAQANAQESHLPLNITVTGHSLGGTLAQLEAHKFGLRGETFNAYGAAGLVHGVPRDGQQVISHVRAGDVVSAASAHFGEVRVYATQQDIDTLGKGGYRDSGSALSARNPARATDFSAHSVDNFVPQSKTLGRSIMAPESGGEARYRAHHGMIDRYRNDVFNARSAISVPMQTGAEIGQTARHGAERVGHAAEQAYDATRYVAVQGAHQVQAGARRVGQAAQQAFDAAHDEAVRRAQQAGRALDRASDRVEAGVQRVGHAAGQAYDATRDEATRRAQQAERALDRAGDAVRERVEAGSRRVGEVLDRASQKMQEGASRIQEGASRLLDRISFHDGAHPGHRMFRQAQAGMQTIDAQQGRTSDHRTDNAAGALAASSLKAGMTRIDAVELNGERGEQIVASQGKLGSALSRVAVVDTAQAFATPLAQSSQTFAEVHGEQLAKELAQTLHSTRGGPVMS